MKVLHLIPSLDPRGGGPAEGVRQIAGAGRALGQQTTVVSLDAPDAPYLRDNPFTAVALGPAVLNYGYTPRLVPWLKAHARQFDAAIVHGIWQYSSLGAWRALHGTGTPYFVFPHGMLDPYFKRAYPLKHWKKWLYWRLFEQRVLRDARAVFFTCEEEMHQARASFNNYHCREEVAGFGTAAPVVERATGVAAFHGAFPGLEHRRRLLFLGRIHEKKGCDLLVEAFSGVAASDPQWQLIMAGPVDPALGARLQSLAQARGIAERITWTGMLANDIKWGALYAAEVFILPSHQENFGIAVAEALACGTPVLISDRVNIWREVGDGGAGFIAPDTLAGTRDLLRRWSATEEPVRHEMRRRARACFERHFDIHRSERRLMGTVNRLITAQPGDG